MCALSKGHDINLVLHDEAFWLYTMSDVLSFTQRTRKRSAGLRNSGSPQWEGQGEHSVWLLPASNAHPQRANPAAEYCKALSGCRA